MTPLPALAVLFCAVFEIPEGMRRLRRAFWFDNAALTEALAGFLTVWSDIR